MRSSEPCGVVWIRRGSEVAEQGRAAPELGDYGTTARIVDWDQLPNGLLGITIQGEARFELFETSMRSNGLLIGEVEPQPAPQAAPMRPQWQPMLDVLQSLETHPHVQRLGLTVDYDDAWQVAASLTQLLPLEEHIKYELLGVETVDEMMRELDIILNQISGEE